MFDRVIQPSDDDARRRSAASFAFTSAVCVAAIGGFLLGSLLVHVATPPPALVEAPMVFLEASGGGPDVPLPAVPEKPRAEPVVPTEPTEPNPDAEPVVNTPVVTPSPPSGGGGGTGTATGPGIGIGPPGIGTDPSGTGDGGDGTVRSFSHPKLVVRKRVDPPYPETARALGLGEQRCLATVYIDEDGAPYQVDVEACPSAFHAATRQSLLEWRWYPPKDGKNRVKTQTAVGITYRLDR